MSFKLFVNGTLMRGLKLHSNMGISVFLGEFRTQPHYRIHSIGDVHPGMYRLGDHEAGGAAIWGELYEVSEEVWQAIKVGEPPHLYRGMVCLEDGQEVYGILYPRDLAEGLYPDISHYGGWRQYVNSRGNLRIVSVMAAPYPFEFDISTTAFLIIDMQRDFLEPGGFGEMLGNDVSLLRTAIEPTREVLEMLRGLGMRIIHTREGHRPDLTDLPPAKKARGNLTCGIGDVGPMGRILVRGEAGHDIIDELKPLPTEPVIDKPGKGSFYATDLESILRNSGITRLIIAGVTTEVCVHTTVREANDRGFECLVLTDCVASYFTEFQRVALEMITAQGGIFGWTAPSSALHEAIVGAGLRPAQMPVAQP